MRQGVKHSICINKGVVHDAPTSDYSNTKQEYQHVYL